jgi:hypothetical protein
MKTGYNKEEYDDCSRHKPAPTAQQTIHTLFPNHMIVFLHCTIQSQLLETLPVIARGGEGGIHHRAGD